MKKSDIMLVLVFAAIGIVVAYFLCNALLPEIEVVTFKTIGTVEAGLAEPDPEVFNSAALNPTVETYVGSCVDQDKDGELSLTESVLCMKENGGPSEETEEEESNEEQSNEEEHEEDDASEEEHTDDDGHDHGQDASGEEEEA